jgi:hypothetical protein
MNDDRDGDLRGPTDLRSRIEELAEKFDVGVDDLLIQSRRRDAMWKGTDADHRKAEWFARYWRRAVEHRDEKRIHVRGVHYFICMLDDDVWPPTECSWDVYQNTTQCYDYLESCAKLARILGYIPLDGIEDKKHGQRVVTEYGTHRRRPETLGVTVPTGVSAPHIPRPDERAKLRFDPDTESFAEYAADRLAGRLIESIRFDGPTQAPFHLEVWSEKTLPDYVKTVCRDYGVNVVVEGEGDLSLTIAHELAERVESAGKPAVILYLSDFDVKGDEMAGNMAAKLAWLKARGDITQRVCIEQLAVTREQIQELGLPRKPIEASAHTGTGGKSYNTRITEWEERKGAGATELNALENRPDAFKSILQEGLAPYVDPALAEKNAEARDEYRDELADVIRESLSESGVEDDLSQLRRWVAEFNDSLDRAEPMLRALRDQQEGFLSEWSDVVREVIEDTAFPVADVPDGEGAYPDAPLYDSERSYVENLQRIQRYKNE